MNIKIVSDFKFSVSSIQYAPNGELCIALSSGENRSNCHYQYVASLGDGQAEEKPVVSLLQYAKDFVSSANIKDKTKDCYSYDTDNTIFSIFLR